MNRPGSSFNATLAFIKRVTPVCRSAAGHNSSLSTRLSVRGALSSHANLVSRKTLCTRARVGKYLARGVKAE